jgi:PAS domain S-box-containing protein
MTDRRDVDEARYRALFETTPDGIMIVDDAGAYVDLNEAMCRMLGGTREELLGHAFPEFIPPDLLHDATSQFAALQSGGALAVEFPIRRLDGTIVNLEWRSRGNFVPGLHLCVARDLGPRDEAERALRESEERYRAFMHNTSEAIWRFELEQPIATDLPIDEQIDLVYRYAYLAECNDAMARMYGFASKSDIIGIRIGDMLVRDNPENIEYLRAFMVAGYSLANVESREVDRDGNEKFFINSLTGILENGFVLRAWGVQRDATEQKQVERERAALLSRLEFLADVTAVLGSSLDYDVTLRSVAEAAVPRFADWCFIDVVEASGNVQRVAVHHSKREMIELALEAERKYPTPPHIEIGPLLTVRTGVTQTYDIPDELLTSNAQSEEHLAMLRGLSLRHGLVVPLTARGRTVGVLSFANSETPRSFSGDDVRLAEDIGRRAGLAIDNARLYSELERAGRAKDDFLAMLSHELRTPMTATLGWATMLQSGSIPADLLATAADSIAQSTRAQARLVDDLLDISRIISGKMQLTLQPIVLADVIAAAIETVRPAAEAKLIAIDVDLRAADVRLNADAERLQQVFWNLLSNAVKFTPRAGRIDVELSRDADGAALVLVRDSGEGIDPALLPYIFDRFRQGDSGASRRHGGLGLGLSIARNLVEMHGGTLRAASGGVGRGAEFIVTLPATLDTRAAAVATPARQTAPLAGLVLLVVEDDEATRVMLETALRQFGAKVRSATNAADAFALLGMQHFDVVLSDIGLPGEDGCSLLMRVRESGNAVAAIALTAYASSSERDRAFASGFESWLAKPIEPRLLAEEVRKLAAS